MVVAVVVLRFRLVADLVLVVLVLHFQPEVGLLVARCCAALSQQGWAHEVLGLSLRRLVVPRVEDAPVVQERAWAKVAVALARRCQLQGDLLDVLAHE